MLAKLKNVRLAFPQLWEAKTVNGEGNPAFSGSFIYAKGSDAYKEVEKAVDAVASEKWAAKAPAMLKDLRAKDKTALHDGDLKENYDGFKGNFFTSARSKNRPLTIDRDKSVLTQQDGKPYGGCYVNAHLDIWAQDNNFGKRINATLVGVQFVKDGDPFSGGVPANVDDFESVIDEDDDLA
jgi:hypothetical protein